MSLPYFRTFQRDWLADTRALTPAQRGVYATLTNLMFEADEPLRNDPKRLARLCCCATAAFERLLAALINEKLIIAKDGHLTSPRVERELEWRRDFSKKQSENALSGQEKKRNKINRGDATTALPDDGHGYANSESIIQKTDTRASHETRTREPDDILGEFEDEFWRIYPHKVGKPEAMARFRVARRSASLATIMAGLDRYIRNKPPDRQWLNPASFLRDERWEDAPAATVQPAKGNAFAQLLVRMDELDAQPHADDGGIIIIDATTTSSA